MDPDILALGVKGFSPHQIHWLLFQRWLYTTGRMNEYGVRYAVEGSEALRPRWLQSTHIRAALPRT